MGCCKILKMLHGELYSVDLVQYLSWYTFLTFITIILRFCVYFSFVCADFIRDYAKKFCSTKRFRGQRKMGNADIE
jgi:hypothetical protein